uniref:Uncharacterized protein n=1 Tax=Panstrongylus lignarius TaxID=156445 RepID=A0A224Y731_9HEMI
MYVVGLSLLFVTVFLGGGIHFRGSGIGMMLEGFPPQVLFSIFYSSCTCVILISISWVAKIPILKKFG